MKAIPSLFIALLLSSASFSQKIVIGGKEELRPLTWTDFPGKVDNSSPFYAMTGWNISYRYGNVTAVGESVKIGKFEAILQLDPKTSWVKKENATDDLLKHEQTHFSIGVLALNELLAKFKEASLTKSNYNAVLQNIFNTTMVKYSKMGDQYDKETDHSKNKEAQTKWNAFVETELAKYK